MIRLSPDGIWFNRFKDLPKLREAIFGGSNERVQKAQNPPTQDSGILSRLKAKFPRISHIPDEILSVVLSNGGDEARVFLASEIRSPTIDRVQLVAEQNGWETPSQKEAKPVFEEFARYVEELTGKKYHLKPRHRKSRTLSGRLK